MEQQAGTGATSFPWSGRPHRCHKLYCSSLLLRDPSEGAHLFNRLTSGLAEDLVDIVAEAHELARFIVDVTSLAARRA